MQSYLFSFNTYRSGHHEIDADSVLEAWLTDLDEPSLSELDLELARAVHTRSPTLKPYKHLIELARHIFLAEGKASLFPTDLNNVRKVLALLKSVTLFVILIRARMIEMSCSMALSRVWQEGYDCIGGAFRSLDPKERDRDFIARQSRKKGE